MLNWTPHGLQNCSEMARIWLAILSEALSRSPPRLDIRVQFDR